MKYLLLIVVVALVLSMIVPRRRIGRGAPPPGKEARPRGAESMVACAQCGMHLPQGEALPGVGGVFCSDAHRAAYEAAHRR